ncbi:MAG: hypothetical protein ACU826_12525 [Gammaproteobacteria bacterium]
MKFRPILTSMTRISNLAETGFLLRPIGRNQWETGDYVAAEVTDVCGRHRLAELADGRMVELSEGDVLIGALGQRAATLEAVGDWRDMDEDSRFDLMTPAGLLGKITSRSFFLPPILSLLYRGHVTVEGKKSRMADFALRDTGLPFDLPVVLLIGTSMSAGKTTSARLIVRLLKKAGLRVIGAKLTGAGRYRDALSLKDAGADEIYDFVDIGLPSTICAPDSYRELLGRLLSNMAGSNADVLVAEAGASPLEPYNGAAAVEVLSKWIRCTVLCASDPYAAAGVISAFERKPDIIAGGAANTSAGIALVKKLTSFRALNLQDRNSIPELSRVLSKCLDFDLDVNGQTR